MGDSREDLEVKKTEIKASGGWTGPINRQINRCKETDEIRAEIQTRQSQRKPTKQLEEELVSRGEL